MINRDFGISGSPGRIPIKEMGLALIGDVEKNLQEVPIQDPSHTPSASGCGRGMKFFHP